MTNTNDHEVLDFCRIKKIFEKGFGFLSSLYHNDNVFFHFSRINDEEKKEALSSLKRGVVSIFFTSKLINGKRKVDKVWLNIEDVPERFLPAFVNRLILELNGGRTNPFEIIEALNQLRVINRLSEEDYSDILSSIKIMKNPSILLKFISANESNNNKRISDFLDELKDGSISYSNGKDILLKILNCKE